MKIPFHAKLNIIQFHEPLLLLSFARTKRGTWDLIIHFIYASLYPIKEEPY
jgi:hypothetical protein